MIPTGGTLGKVAKISMENMDERIKSAQIITMCDIDNPMYGKSGQLIFSDRKKVRMMKWCSGWMQT